MTIVYEDGHWTKEKVIQLYFSTYTWWNQFWISTWDLISSRLITFSLRPPVHCTECHMENLDWDGSQVALNCNSDSWESQHQQIKESLMMSNSHDLSFHGGFNSIQMLHKTNSSQSINSNSNSNNHMFQQYVTPIHAFPNLNYALQHHNQDATKVLLDDHNQAPNSTGDPANIMMSQLNGLITASYGMENQPTAAESLQLGAAATSRSLDQSLDCLLSATNSNTGTSVEEDDGISMIFSDCKNLMNFGAGTLKNYAISSSGDSASDGIVNQELDQEILSQTSSEHRHANTDQATKFKAKKRTFSSITDHQATTKLPPAARNYDHLLHSEYSCSSTAEAKFQLISENPQIHKKPRSEKRLPTSSNINFQLQPIAEGTKTATTTFSSMSSVQGGEPDSEAIAQMKEMIYRAAAFRPVNFGTEVLEKPKRKNVRISTDPQTVAARQRRERISERIRVLQRMVPGGSKMDTATMLDEAANYLKFLRSQVKALEVFGEKRRDVTDFAMLPFNGHNSFPMQSYFPLQSHHHQKNPN